MKGDRQKRDGNIELLRFMAGVSIAAYHFEWVYIGYPVYFQHFYIWVEFFFVVSGFFLALNAKDEGDLSSYRYVFRQWKKLYPLYAGGFCFTFFIVNFLEKNPFAQWIEGLWRAKWEVLLLGIAGFDNDASMYNLGGAPAYISALLICSLILHYFMIHYRNEMLHVWLPIGIVVIFGRIMNVYGNLSQWMTFDGICNLGLLRGFADMSVGIMCAFVIVPYLKGRKMLWGGVKSLILLTLILGMLTIFRNKMSYNDMVYICLLFGFLISGLYVLPAHTSDRISKWMIYLGKLSYPIFLFHYGILLLFKEYLSGLDYKRGISLFVVSVVGIAVLVLQLEKMAGEFLRWKRQESR